jgi:hypothetical protein
VKKKAEIPKAILEDLYINQQKPVTEISEIVGWSTRVVFRKLAEYGLNRPTGTYKRTIEDLTGREFGSLKVLKQSHVDKNGSSWLCLCACGKEKVIPRCRLIKGSQVTCGCGCNRYGQKDVGWTGYEQISGWFWTHIKRGAVDRPTPVEFDITIEYAWNKFIEQGGKCALTGLPLVFEKRFHDAKNRTASLDRIDSSKGYIEGNIQWVHKDINKMKWNYPEEKFIEFCKLVAEYRK